MVRVDDKLGAAKYSVETLENESICTKERSKIHSWCTKDAYVYILTSVQLLNCKAEKLVPVPVEQGCISSTSEHSPFNRQNWLEILADYP